MCHITTKTMLLAPTELQSRALGDPGFTLAI